MFCNFIGGETITHHRCLVVKVFALNYMELGKPLLLFAHVHLQEPPQLLSHRYSHAWFGISRGGMISITFTSIIITDLH